MQRPESHTSDAQPAGQVELKDCATVRRKQARRLNVNVGTLVFMLVHRSASIFCATR
jgi:hypothetical protein